MPGGAVGLDIRASLLTILVAKIGSHFGSSNVSSCLTGFCHWGSIIGEAQPLKWGQEHLSDLVPLSSGIRTG